MAGFLSSLFNKINTRVKDQLNQWEKDKKQWEKDKVTPPGPIDMSKNPLEQLKEDKKQWEKEKMTPPGPIDMSKTPKADHKKPQGVQIKVEPTKKGQKTNITPTTWGSMLGGFLSKKGPPDQNTVKKTDWGKKLSERGFHQSDKESDQHRGKG